MDELTAQLSQLRLQVDDERQRRQQAEAQLAAARAVPHPTPPAAHYAPAVALPDKFDGQRGLAAESFARQLRIYVAVHPERFATNASKILFAASFMTGHASQWAKPFVDAAIDGDTDSPQAAVNFAAFESGFFAYFFDSNKQDKAERALRSMKQTGTVNAYTQSFNQFAHDAGWEQSTLVSQYRHGLKENIRLALVVARTTFPTLSSVQALAIEIGAELEGHHPNNHPFSQRPPASTPAPDPNAMDLSAFRQRLSDPERARRSQLGLCFRCGKSGHVSRDCPKKRPKPTSAARISELQAEIDRLRAGPSDPEPPKNGTTQD